MRGRPLSLLYSNSIRVLQKRLAFVLRELVTGDAGRSLGSTKDMCRSIDPDKDNNILYGVEVVGLEADSYILVTSRSRSTW